MTDGILLGFELDTGEPVYLPLHHAGITGMTGKAGKSTAIEGAGRRSEYRVIAFLTKRGEQAFRKAKRIPLYFKEQSDWQYVESLLEAELREDKRFERAWIIKVCRGTKGKLRAVWDNVKEAKKKARKDSLSERIYICLDAYFEIIIPELEKHDFAKTLELGKEPDVYVMDLIGMSESTQAVIIRSALEYIHIHEKRVICTVPEAWKFVGLKSTPVLDIAERIIKQGFAVKTFLWVDSQDIASINPKIRGQIDNWVLGRQRYEHEINRTLGFIPVKNKPTTEQIQTLKLGFFFVACEDWVKSIYALPYGVPEDEGIAVALGKKTPEEIRDKYLKPRPFGEMQSEAMGKVLEDFERVSNELADAKEELDAVRDERDDLAQAIEGYGEKVKDLNERNEDLQQTIEEQRTRLVELEGIEPFARAMRGMVEPIVNKAIDEVKTYVVHELQDEREWVDEHTKDMLAHPDIHGIDIKIEDFLKDKIEEILEHPEQFNITVTAPQTRLTVEKPVHTLNLTEDALAGRIAIVYAEGLLPAKVFTINTLVEIMTRRFGRKEAHPNFKKPLRNMVAWGFLTLVQAGRRYDYKVAISPEDAREKGLLIVKEVKA